MKYKKIMLILITAIFLVSIASVCAADANDTMVASDDANQMVLSSNNVIVEDNLQTGEKNTTLMQANDDETVSAESDSQRLGEGEGTYYDLINEIGDGGDKNLTKSYYKYTGGDTIKITTSGVINGNGAVIDMVNERAFYVSASGVTIKNLTIKNAHVYNYDYGGAIYFSQSGSVINCNFTENNAESAGAIHFEADGTVTNCNFAGNRAQNVDEGDGGAVCFCGYGTVTNCNFAGNDADIGGAVCFWGGGEVINCNFVDNKATGDYAKGGAIFFSSYGDVTNCNFTNNTATGCGGAVCFLDQGTVSNCNFADNKATGDYGWGGAIFFSSYGDVTNCNFTANTANEHGGAVFFDEDGTVTNCNFVNNYANYDAGAIYNTLGHSTADTCIFKEYSDTTYQVHILPPTLNVDNFTTFYGSDEKLIFNLTTNSGMPVTNGDISISVYYKNNNSWFGGYSCLSGEGWTVDLPVGSYYAIFDTEYAGFNAINRTITVIPNIPYYANVTPVTTNNKTVNITAKSNIPQDIIEGKLLFFLPNGDEINATYAADGIWWAVHTFDDYADYQVNTSYVGLSNVILNNATISITRANSTVNVSDVVLDYGEAKNVTVTADGATGITAKINDTNVTVVNNFTIPISGLAAGNYTLTVTTIPDGDHNPATKTVNITVNKAGTEITLSNETLYLKAGDIVSDLANLTPADAGDLTFQSSNDDIAIAADGTIYARVKGNVTVTVSFAGTDNYAAAESKTIMVYVTLKDASVSVENETLNLNVNEKYEFNPTANPSFLAVQYSSSNESVVTVTDYGLVRAVGEGTAIITLAVGNNQTYAINTTNVTVTVSLNDASISLNNSTLDLFIDDTFTIVATTTPAGLNVTYVQDDSGVYTVDSNGVVTALKTGTGNILVKVGGDGVYVENSTEIPVTVSKVPTEIAADPIAATYNANKDLVITLKDSRGKPLSGLNITVDFNGAKNYTTDSSGQVKIPTKGLAANIYDVLISFNGTDKYLNCSNTTTVSIYKESSRVDTKPLTTDYNVHKYLVVGLKDNEGNPIRNADAYIEIHGVTYKCRSDDAGNARLIIRLNPGTYTAKITFDNVNYTGFTQYVTVIVKKLTPKLTAAKKTFKKSVKTKKYTVTLKANNKALAKVKLTLKVKGKTYKAKTNAKGKAVFKIKKLTKKGKYKATVKFAGNTYYNKVTKKVKITIK